ncbi:MAG TPA: hypothetical protein VIS49_05905, partial [Cyclobacteriaceae bacterium]
EEIYFPFILETDEFGNQVQFRNYAIFQGELEQYLENEGFDNSFEAIFPSIFEVTKLSTGNYFAIGMFFAPKLWQSFTLNFHVTFYALLDPKLALLKWGYFNDTDLEAIGWDGIGWPNWRGFLTINKQRTIHETALGTILYLMDASNMANGTQCYSVYKFSLSAEMLDVWNYCPDSVESDIWGYRGSGWTPDDQGNMVSAVRRWYLPGDGMEDPDITLQVFKQNDGKLLKTVNYGQGQWGFPWNILPIDDGYVIQHFSSESLQLGKQGDRETWGALLFVNHDLDSIRNVHVTTANFCQSGGPFIKTRDGGFVAAFLKNNNNNADGILIKTDSQGNPLWQYEEPGRAIVNIVEMDDGGIAFVTRREFNEVGNRITLVKLTADGKL